MSKVTSNIPANFGGNADFETWVTAIHNALSTLGFIQTGDTGQIVPASVARPGVGGTAAGYEIWRFADAAQATTPIFLKIEYGTGNTTDQPSLWITTGSSTNGAGTLTGQVTSRQSAQAGASKGAGVVLPFFACSDGSDLALAVNVDTAGTFGLFIYIGRPRDTTGTATTEGCWQYVCSNGNNTTGQSQFAPNTGAVPASVGAAFPGVSPSQYSRSSQGDNACICVAMQPIWGNWRFQRLALCNPGDFPAGGSLTATIFGGSHVFLSLASAISSQPLTNQDGNGGNPGLVIPWE